MKKAIFVLLAFLLSHLGASSQEIFRPNIRQRESKEINFTLPFFQKSQGLFVEIVDGYAIFEGDIILYRDVPSERDAGIFGDNFRWPEGIIPFEIENGHPDNANILAAINLINQKTVLRVQPRNGQADFVRFVNGGGCASWVGRQGVGRQDITIGGCSVGSIQHEILHAAGMFHEQSRSDRDNFVQILTQNIIPGRENNFRRVDNTISICNYDFGSIMHYPSTAFGINGQVTIQPINPLPAGVVMGQRTALSQCDIDGIRNLYPQNSMQLSPGQFIRSPNQQYELIYQSDGNLVIYKTNGSSRTATWSSRTDGNPAGICVMQGDGNLVIYKPNMQPIWQSDTWGQQFFNSRLHLQDDGNLVIYDRNNKAIWSTGTSGSRIPKDMLLPNELLQINQDIWSNNRQYRLIYQGDGNLVIYKNKNGAALWSSATQGKPAGRCIMQGDGNLVIYTPTGQAVWSSGTFGTPFTDSKLVMQDDGNLVIYKANGQASWSSGTHGR